ncbi:hypothetical protein [Saccharopolyspora shandongensis]|uniref:hypothetical protein n=1 Tax=Saccharopolyspora shandongensis TaxID=418495 RepID=UPI0033D9CA14
MSEQNWLRPGAEVVLWSKTVSGELHRIKPAVVDRVGRKFFFAGEEKFSIETMERRAGKWDSVRHVAPTDSPMGMYVLAYDEWVSDRLRAAMAWERWMGTGAEADKAHLLRTVNAVPEKPVMPR